MDGRVEVIIMLSQLLVVAVVEAGAELGNKRTSIRLCCDISVISLVMSFNNLHIGLKRT